MEIESLAFRFQSDILCKLNSCCQTAAGFCPWLQRQQLQPDDGFHSSSSINRSSPLTRDTSPRRYRSVVIDSHSPICVYFYARRIVSGSHCSASLPLHPAASGTKTRLQTTKMRSSLGRTATSTTHTGRGNSFPSSSRLTESLLTTSYSTLRSPITNHRYHFISLLH